MIQSHYVKQEPPYQVIFCNGEVGIQTGSLIVVEENRGPNGEYGLLTHTHPVVNYGSKEVLESKTSGPHDIKTLEGDFVQGAVWEKVEVSDVLVIGLLGTKVPGTLNENSFSELAYGTLINRIQQRQPVDFVISKLYKRLTNIGMNPKYGTFKEVALEMELNDHHDVHYIIIHDENYYFQMAIPFDTIPQMAKMVQSQILEYEWLLANGIGNTVWHFEYAWESLLSEMVYDDGRPIEEEHLISQLAKELNKAHNSNS